MSMVKTMIPEFFVGCKVVLPADLICEDEDVVGTVVKVVGAELVVAIPGYNSAPDQVRVFAHEVKQVVL